MEDWVSVEEQLPNPGERVKILLDPDGIEVVGWYDPNNECWWEIDNDSSARPSHWIPLDNVHHLPMGALENGVWYKGYCAGERGPEEMMWDSEREEFQYWRYKFGEWFIDFMEHEDDPKRYPNIEGFIPLRPKE